jgi:lysophospholipase L1-like esterase
MPKVAAPQPTFSRRRSLAFSLLLIGAFFGAVEAVLRLVGIAPPLNPRILVKHMDSDVGLPFMRPDPDLFWSPIPGYHGAFQGKPVTINSTGLRGPEVETPKQKGRTRVVTFGDSITFGYGVGDDETYPYQLGRLLAPYGAEVVNAGVTGYSSHQVLGLLRRLLPQLDADAVTICIGWNDGNRRPVDDREYARRLAQITSVEGPLDHLYLYRAMKRAYVKATALKGLDEHAATGRRATLAQYRENLELIVRECRQHGVRPVFIALPRRRSTGEKVPDGSYAQTLLESGKALGVPVLSSGDLGLETTLANNDRYFIDLLHLSPEGADVMAKTLTPQLIPILAR